MNCIVCKGSAEYYCSLRGLTVSICGDHLEDISCDGVIDELIAS